MRNESEVKMGLVKQAPLTDLDIFLIDLSKSIYARTRKMVNYS
jgi:hypothetical protein